MVVPGVVAARVTVTERPADSSPVGSVGDAKLVGALTEQVPWRHASSGAQACVQLPQCFGSVKRLASQPLAAAPSQSAKPLAHTAMLHAPLEQTPVACGGAEPGP